MSDVLEQPRKNNPVSTWDFRFMRTPSISVEFIREWLEHYTKRWVFQLEKGEGGIVHYQGRFSLKLKKRKSELINVMPWIRDTGVFFLEPTAKNTISTDKDWWYVCKEDTRVEGPWKSDDKKARPEDLTPQDKYAYDHMYPYQKKILDMARKPCTDYRTINIILDPKGGKGKSGLCSLISYLTDSIALPCYNSYKELLNTAASLILNKGLKVVNMVVIDMPRSIPKNDLAPLYAAIESIKSGYIIDSRFKATEVRIPSPHVWVFTNMLPDLNYLSLDRWKIWRINKDKDLEPYEGPLNKILNKVIESGFDDERDEIAQKRADLMALIEYAQAELAILNDREQALSNSRYYFSQSLSVPDKLKAKSPKSEPVDDKGKEEESDEDPRPTLIYDLDFLHGDVYDDLDDLDNE